MQYLLLYSFFLLLVCLIFVCSHCFCFFILLVWRNGFCQKHPPYVFCRNKCFRNFPKFKQENTYAWDPLLIKSQVPATLIKKSLWYRCFPVNFGKFLGTPFLQNTSRRLLLFCLWLLLLPVNLWKSSLWQKKVFLSLQHNLKFPKFIFDNSSIQLKNIPAKG